MKEIKELLRKLEPMIGPKAKRLWYLGLTSKDEKSDHENTALLRLLADKNADFDYREEIRLPPPAPELLAGDYPLGTVVYPGTEYSEFALREPEFIKHILIVGMTGTGKTNLTFHLLQQLARNNKPFLILDWKRNYQALRQLPGFENLKVIRLGTSECQLSFNPLIPPPSVPPRQWMPMLIDVIKHAFFVGHGVEYFLRKAIDHLYRQFGIYDNKTDYPTFAELQHLLQKEYVRGREMLWMSSIKRVLSILTMPSLLGEMLSTRKQGNIQALLHGQVVIEMDNLATIEKIFFVESLLLWIYHHLKSQSSREQFHHAIVLEEAHHILSGRKETITGEESVIETVIRMIREFGESIIAIDQEPSKISNSILANTNCKICFNLGNGKDIATIARAMSLNPEEQDCIDKLQVGHAIIKMKDRFTQPIHVRFPLVPIDKNRLPAVLP